MVYLFTFEQWVDAYQKAGIRLMPIEGRWYSKDTGERYFDEKDPGFKDWPNYVASKDALVRHMRYKWRWGITVGKPSNNLMIVDYDIQKELGSEDAAYAWRLSHSHALRDLDTPVVFTPSGGCHVWFRLPDGRRPDPAEVADLTYGTFPFAPDLIQFTGNYVLAPPSKLSSRADVRSRYLFLDQDSTVPNLAGMIRKAKGMDEALWLKREAQRKDAMAKAFGRGISH
jgi:hypothetical protein